MVIFGLEDFADIAYEYFTCDSDYEVIAFTVNRNYLNKTEKFGLPIVPFEELALHFRPSEVEIFVAISYRNMNRNRERVVLEARNLGFRLASYISTNSFVWRNVELGEHVFIFENNTLQPFVRIGDNVICWSGNHIGHHSIVGNNVFISSQVVISGWVVIGNNCFLGVNATVVNGVKIDKFSWIGQGANVAQDIDQSMLVYASPAKVVPLNEELLDQKIRKAEERRN